jgi:NAD-dependent deacetylase
LEKDKIPRCDCGGILKPDVVLYGEGLDAGIISGSIEAITRADLLIVGGTSLNVYPAAGLIRFYKGNRIVLINKT